jgi:nucleotide-binding universal stress UspA family protein
VILSSNTNPDDKSMRETSESINVRDTASPTTSADVSISRSNIPSINKILVTHDGKDSSNKAVNYAISLSNLSGAEIVLLRVIEHADKIEGTSVSVEGSYNTDDDDSLKRNVQGPFVDAMEDTIRKCKEAGCKNKISYKFRTGNLVSEIVDEVKAQGYDMVVLTSSHIDSWIRSLFSNTRKIISNVTIPVLVVAAR